MTKDDFRLMLMGRKLDKILNANFLGSSFGPSGVLVCKIWAENIFVVPGSREKLNKVVAIYESIVSTKIL